MSSILDILLQRVQSVESGLRTGQFVRDVLIPRGDDILEQQRIQLLEGKDSGGEDIRPYYSQHFRKTL